MNEDVEWKGLFKIVEESGELCQVLGKLACNPDGISPNGEHSLIPNLYEEIGDLQAALHYFIEANGLDPAKINERIREKTEKFNYWSLAGIKGVTK